MSRAVTIKGLLAGGTILALLALNGLRPTSQRPSEPPDRAIQIVGSEEFQAKTRAALALVRRTRHAETVRRFVAIIREAPRSGMRAYDPEPTYEVGSATWQAAPTWYASTIVHDADHSRLYHEAAARGKGDVPATSWTGADAERTCLRTQVEALEDLDADTSTLTYVRGLIEAPTYQGDSTSDSDYRRRNW
jgi:hypothetical protein